MAIKFKKLLRIIIYIFIFILFFHFIKVTLFKHKYKQFKKHKKHKKYNKHKKIRRVYTDFESNSNSNSDSESDSDSDSKYYVSKQFFYKQPIYTRTYGIYDKINT